MSKKVAHVKVRYEERPHRIEATAVQEQDYQLVVYNSEAIMARFPLAKVEQWSLENEE